MGKEIHHIERGNMGTWCGKTNGWHFLSLDHAAENSTVNPSLAQEHGPCPECVQAALNAMGLKALLTR